LAGSVVGLALEEARAALAAAGAPAPAVVEVADARERRCSGRWRVIRARLRGGELELTVARQRELAEVFEPDPQEGERAR